LADVPSILEISHLVFKTATSKRHYEMKNKLPHIVTTKPVGAVKVNFLRWNTSIDKEQYTNQGVSVQEIPLGK
jgi:hypothetical protein